jgi:flavin-dependent dehydrogenase
MRETGGTVLEVDVFILGAGPAGCSAALHLAPFYRTLMIDRQPAPQPRAGESLPPAANKLLRDMGLFDEFKGQGHLPYYGNQSRWGSGHLRETDFLRDPLGHGWHLDRREFELWLRNKAIQRGAALLAPARLAQVEYANTQRWKVAVIHADRRLEIEARILIDAGGRTPVIARRLGATRLHLDNMVCSWVIGQAEIGHAGQGLSYIHSAPQGWWYTAPIPGGKCILAFHTRAGSAGTAWMHSAQSLIEQAEKIHHLRERIPFNSKHPGQLQHGITAAHSAITQPAAGNGWLAVGDAALSFDPLSSQGIFNALYTGLAASESVDRFLQGAISSFAEYQQQLETIRTSYESHLREWYRSEKRWSREEFWQGR